MFSSVLGTDFFTVMYLFDYVFTAVGVLVGVAFFTLFERKILGYVHFRKGPTKVGYFGLLQPFSDAIKLFSKELFKGVFYTYYLYIFAPLIGLFLMILLWLSYPHFCGLFTGSFLYLFFFCLLSMGVYFLLLSGWGSNSKYSLLGGYRAVAQTISYEISFILFALIMFYVLEVFDFMSFFYFQSGWWFSAFSLVVVFFWSGICLAETNRSPYDFSEGESELVSGFNVEYGGGLFSLIFICEYGMILLLSYFSVLVLGGGSLIFFKCFCVGYVFVWVRCCYPRYRYDKLMNLAWKVFLPFSLCFLFIPAFYF